MKHFITGLLVIPVICFLISLVITPIGGFNPNSLNYHPFYKPFFYISLYSMILSAAITLYRMNKSQQ